MGNSPSFSKNTQQPCKPFQDTRTSCFQAHMIPTSQSRPSTLQQLILLQDWQRVLIRANLYPAEVRHDMKLTMEDLTGNKVQARVLPLHLACALDPPLAVVQVLLNHFVDAAALSIRSYSNTAPIQKKKRRWKPRLRRRKREKRHKEDGAFPVAQSDDETKSDDREILLPKSPNVEANSIYYSAEQNLNEISFSDGERSQGSSSLSSKPSWNQDKSFVLQLALSKEEQPKPIKQSDTHSTSGSSCSSAALFRVQWDMEPLHRHIFQQGGLLPLHIACLYRSSESVLQELLDIYPSAALAPVLGMLPVHWVAAGWTLPELEPPPVSLIPPMPKPGPMELLKVLKQAAPESMRVQSGNHGMVPLDYVEECMEDGEYKEACLAILLNRGEDSVSSPPYVFADSDSEPPPVHELIACVSALIADHNWEHVLALIEDDPSLAEQWVYGVDEMQVTTPVIWKRLPIHLACGMRGVPSDLISCLLDAYPEAAQIPDPHSGSLAMHLACENGASLSVILTLLHAWPNASIVTNQEGRVPLHIATRKMAYDIVEALVEHDPSSISAVDLYGKTPADYARPNSQIAEMLDTVHLFHREDCDGIISE